MYFKIIEHFFKNLSHRINMHCQRKHWVCTLKVVELYAVQITYVIHNKCDYEQDAQHSYCQIDNINPNNAFIILFLLASIR